MKRTLLAATTALSIVMLGLCLVFLATNFHAVPNYGDTPEYIALSRTLKVDQYRGIVYPVLICLSNWLTGSTKHPYTDFLYPVQIVLLVLSSGMFSISIWRRAFHGQPIASSVAWPVAAAALASANPLSAHFAVTVLTDSLASSLTILQLGLLLLATERGTTSWRCATWLALAGIVTVLASCLRIEKLYLSVCIYLALLALLAFRKRQATGRMISNRFLCVGATLALTIVASLVVKKETTVPDLNRPPLNVEMSIFNRVVWPNMTDALPYMPAKIRQTILPATAEQFDSHNNFVYPFQVEALRDTHKGLAYLNEISAVTFKHFYVRVITATIFDFSKYMLPAIAFPLEAKNIVPQSWATSWTVTRAQEATPRITHSYLVIGSLAFFALLASALAHQRLFKKLNSETWQAMIFVLATVASNAAMFAMESGMHAHIRYGLPTYTLSYLLISIMFLASLLKTNNPSLATGDERRPAN